MGGSLWFSTNGVADQLLNEWSLSTTDLGYLTSAVQLGFILGTFLFAMSGLSDRFKASQMVFGLLSVWSHGKCIVAVIQ